MFKEFGVHPETKKGELLDQMNEQAEKIKIEQEDCGYPNGELLSSLNGFPSQFEEREWKMVRTEAFKKWFDGSKVVDEHGEPLKVFQRSKIDKGDDFKLGERNTPTKEESGFGKEGVNNLGFFFSDKSDMTHYGQHVKEAFLSLKNIFDVSDIDSRSSFNQFEKSVKEKYPDLDIAPIAEKFEEFRKRRNKDIYGNEQAEDIKDSLQATFNYFELSGGTLMRGFLLKNGFDGAKFKDLEDGNSYVALNPDQILILKKYKEIDVHKE